MNRYQRYYLNDNPFPVTPILDPASDKPQINGTIYNPDVMATEIESFESKIRRRPPLIYIENSDFVRGVGKSALVVQQWRKLQEDKYISSIYLRSEKKLKPADFASRVIDRWHQQGDLWPAVLKTVKGYVEANPDGEITKAGAERLGETFAQMPRRPISLLNFNVFNPEQLIDDLAAWVNRQVGVGLPVDLARVFFQSYLTDPSTFLNAYPKILRKQKLDQLTMLAAMYRLLKLGDYVYNYLFFDQFEDVVHGLSGKSLLTFNTEMRRLIEASIGYATIVVTLHPGATNTLSSNEGGDITSVAPMDERHVVDVRRLTEKGASQIARTYLNHFRLGNSPSHDALYPFDDAAILEIYKTAKGNVRACLQAFNYAIEKGVDTNSPVIDSAFLTKFHSDITGRVHPDEVVLTGGM